MKIGIIGAGNIGGTLGRLWADAGHDVFFATRNPINLAKLAQELGAQAGSPVQACGFAEIVLFAAPYGAWPDFARQNANALAGKIVIDAANPYAHRDGAIVQDVARSGLGAGGYTARLIPRSDVVKAFNTIYWTDLRDQAHKDGDKLAIPIAGPKKDAEIVAGLARDAGFDPVIVGDLSKAPALDPGTPVYAKSLTAKQLRAMVDQ